jgi:hypothetical protein
MTSLAAVPSLPLFASTEDSTIVRGNMDKPGPRALYVCRRPLQTMAHWRWKNWRG